MLSTVPLKSAADLDAPVAEVMRHGVIALPSTATLAEAAAAMRDNRVHAVLVTGSDGGPLGWVTSRGVLHNHARDWSADASAADAITQPAASVASTATVGDALTVFVATGASHILVGATTAPGAPLGVIADSDLVAFMAR
ncbi:MAG: CBS domain-containing protein [Solirubrobacteraceae bacterium]|nr:CBS domain-containing protein [Solirubrobacteraceae bacterium]